MEKIFNTIEKYTSIILIFLLPIFAAGTSSNPFIVPRLELLFYGLSLILFLFSVKTILMGKFEFSLGSFDFPIVILLISYIISTWLRTPNKMEALVMPGTTTAFVGAILLYFLVNQQKEKVKDLFVKVIFYSAALYSFWTILAFSTLLSNIPFIPPFMKAKSFTPDGGYLPSLIFLAGAMPLGIGYAISERNILKKAITFACGIVVTTGLLLSIYNIIPGRQFSPKLLSFNDSWYIAVDSLKASPLFGVGPGNYQTSFNRFRPLTYNNSESWSLKYGSARNVFLTALTEVGMLGFAGFILLFYSIYKITRKDLKESKIVNWGFPGIAKLVSLLLTTLLMVLFPSTPFTVIFFFLILAFNTKTKTTSLNLTAVSDDSQNITTKQLKSRFPAIILTLPVILLVLFANFRSINIVRAEYKFKQSLEALLKNDAAKVYDVMREAINLNPKVDRYRATFSRINLILANAIAAKKDLTDADRTTITQLIQQAITEGKNTVALNPFRSGNWETLARVYQTVIPLAKDADTFAIQTYRQAILLDPIEPNLRIALGGIYYQKKDYDNAIGVFRTVTEQVKPNLANAHFNLAYAYREKGLLDQAITEMTTVLSLLDRTVPDYEIARKALEDLQNKKASTAPTPTGETLTPPTQQQQILKPPVNLPEGSEPPSEVITPTPEVSPSITPILTPTP